MVADAETNWLGIAGIAAAISGVTALLTQLIVGAIDRRHTKRSEQRKQLQVDKQIIGELFGKLAGQLFALRVSYTRMVPIYYNSCWYFEMFVRYNTAVEGGNKEAHLLSKHSVIKGEVLKYTEQNEKALIEFSKNLELSLAIITQMSYIIHNSELKKSILKLREYQTPRPNFSDIRTEDMEKPHSSIEFNFPIRERAINGLEEILEEIENHIYQYRAFTSNPTIVS